MAKFRRIYLYRDSDMPERGWLQSCFLCYTYTSRLNDFKKEECKKKKLINHYVVFICKDCKDELQKEEIYQKYEKKCEDYIKSIKY